MKRFVTSDAVPFFRIKQRLRALGASAYILSRPEVPSLSKLLHKNEEIEAFIYGAYSGGWGMLVATDKKLIFIDKMFLDLEVEEVPYSMISAVDHGYGHLFSKVIVHTRSKDYALRHVNRKCANKFVDYIEKRVLLAQENMQRRDMQELQLPDPRYNYSPNYQFPASYTKKLVR